MGSVYQTGYIDSHTFMLQSNGKTPKEKILKDQRKKTSHLPQSVRMIRFLLATMAARRGGHNIFNMIKRKLSRILCPEKQYF